MGLEQLISSGAGLLFTIAGLIGVWYKFQNKVENLEEARKSDIEKTKDERIEFRRQIEAVWKWKDEHQKEYSSLREDLQAEIAEIRGSTLVINEQFKQILEMLKEIKERLTKLETK